VEPAKRISAIIVANPTFQSVIDVLYSPLIFRPPPFSAHFETFPNAAFVLFIITIAGCWGEGTMEDLYTDSMFFGFWAGGKSSIGGTFQA
jgi:hypothetical protein